MEEGKTEILTKGSWQEYLSKLAERGDPERARLEWKEYLGKFAFALLDQCKDEKITVAEFQLVQEMMLQNMGRTTTLHHV